VHRSLPEEEWLKSLIKTLNYYHQFCGDVTLKTIFFGGGTPSLMAAETASEIIEHICKLWQITPGNLEITLEANPNSVEVEKFQILRAAGINRVSIGIQSFQEKNLKFLGRTHSAQDGVKAIETALAHFDRVSFDLIYALPEQSVQEWQQELNQAMAFDTKHLSLYQLTIEPNTAFHKQYHRGDFHLPSHQHADQLYDMTAENLAKKGMYPYEISNYAAQGHESRHNLLYWRYHQFMGVGPGAHGRMLLNGVPHALKQYLSPVKWATSVAHDAHPGCETQSVLSPLEMFEERMMMNMRLLEPIDINNHERAFIDAHALGQFVDAGFMHNLEKTDSGMCFQMTSKGRLVAHSILNKLLL
ncbi:MAG: radical SAM family heme chaperone HemW, partial [Alphaproteobacteria bacterium]|nr:radical SAM family heme chaperone HemW [Alphaproteobacteria bacterium]